MPRARQMATSAGFVTIRFYFFIKVSRVKRLLTPQILREATAHTAEQTVDLTCDCSVAACESWESMPEARWPTVQMHKVGTLLDDTVFEPTYEEAHPHGTRYGDANAPVAVKFFPYNRCDLWKCSRCEKHLLRYTEFGGYYVDQRVRFLDPKLILD